jgi:SAM-dependent methyltransferase
MKSTRYYDNHAAALATQYDAIESGDIHNIWKKHLPKKVGLACDIGAGTGRDANWLASKGWDVIAVEPSRAMREYGETKSAPTVTWLNDALPHLDKLRTLGHRFDLILLSAVWMHIPAAQRERAFRILSEMLGPSGVLVISLRYGTDEQENAERHFHTVTADELRLYAQRRSVAIVGQYQHADLNRAHVSWETMVIRMPDDGTGSLPILRHIIVNDDKAASYKLGLLRVLTRIAESAPGIVTARTDDYVEIPFGIVGLYWLKQYKPLVITHNIRQHPNRNSGYGFAKDDFYRLKEISNYDLRVGASFEGERAAIVTGAIRDACVNIKAMPAQYISYPGQNRSIFDCETSRVVRKAERITLSKEYLARFGSFRIPAKLWQTFGQYACWLEPAILREWGSLTARWGLSDYGTTNLDVFEWEEGRRDTSLVTKRLAALREQNAPLHCVWSAAKLRNGHIDHCFPWSRWFNSDLWNLLPTNATVNVSKGDKLPSGVALNEAHSRILDWWRVAYLDSPLRQQFLLEAESSLPRLTEGPIGLDDIYESMLHQRTRLKVDQQLVEWPV